MSLSSYIEMVNYCEINFKIAQVVDTKYTVRESAFMFA